jgi:hypothetical protein
MTMLEEALSLEERIAKRRAEGAEDAAIMQDAADTIAQLVMRLETQGKTLTAACALVERQMNVIRELKQGRGTHGQESKEPQASKEPQGNEADRDVSRETDAPRTGFTY